MILFNSDYLEGAHERVMQRLMETNAVQTVGYGEDEYCEHAKATIRNLCNAPEADVHFIVGGTQTNLTFLAAVLKPYQGVLCADSGHIAVHETGSVEACGHAVLKLPSQNGKIEAAQVEEYCRLHFSDGSHEHMVMPGAVYISNPTEWGTLYSASELTALHDVCEKWNLTLFLDGARLGYGLMSEENTLSLPLLAKLCDAFYIGGTKQGLLFGEALVITKTALKPNFRYIMKQKGAMLAKGRLLGVQFDAIFEDDLYFKTSEHADRLAMKLKRALIDAGYGFYMNSPTNQQFPILPDTLLEKLSLKYGFTYEKRFDETHNVVRFCTSWTTKEADVDALIEDIQA